jgi:hypothetical protein
MLIVFVTVAWSGLALYRRCASLRHCIDMCSFLCLLGVCHCVLSLLQPFPTRMFASSPYRCAHSGAFHLIYLVSFKAGCGHLSRQAAEAGLYNVGTRLRLACLVTVVLALFCVICRSWTSFRAKPLKLELLVSSETCFKHPGLLLG